MKYKQLTIFILLALFTFPFLFSCSNVYTYSSTKISSKPDNIKIKISPIKQYDLKSDSSIQKFVGQSVHFNNLRYAPNDLKYIIGTHIVSSKKFQLRKIANENLVLLSNDFYKQFKTKIIIVSGYRDYNYQANIKKGGCPDNLCAKAGYSEHQTGLAVDVFEASTTEQFLKNSKYKSYYQWLKTNASKYGFHNSYQKGAKIDGYDIEPWHWRFVGVELAQKLEKDNFTLTEYYYKFN